MESQGPSKLSTTAIAKLLDIPPHQLFKALKDFGWIRKHQEGWALTGKGEFEGGEYYRSKRYGQYIVWPEAITQAAIISELKNSRMLSAAALGRHFDISPRESNRALAELGWLRRCTQGWELTSTGEKKGGVQLENEQSGTLYVVWPADIVDDSLIKRQFLALAHTPSDDLFNQATTQTIDGDYVSLDGHQFSCHARQQICQCLYLMGLVHACNRQLPVDDELTADFYLPLHQVYIDYIDDNAKNLSKRFELQEAYQQMNARVIEVQAQDLSELDEIIARALRKFGVYVL